MTKESEERLFRLLKDGDTTAKEQLAKENFGLVHMAARRFLGRNTDYDDLFQIGCIGLIKAVERFDIESGNKFSTYAVPVIIGELKRHFRDTGAIKVSRSIRENGNKLTVVRELLTAELEREPTVEELSEKSGISAEDVILALDCARPVLSLSAAVGDGGGSLYDLVGEDSLSDICDLISLREAINGLSKQERQIIKERYFKNKTQQQTAQIFGISQVQVSRTEQKVKKKLKEMLI